MIVYNHCSRGSPWISFLNIKFKLLKVSRIKIHVAINESKLAIKVDENFQWGALVNLNALVERLESWKISQTRPFHAHIQLQQILASQQETVAAHNMPIALQQPTRFSFVYLRLDA
jgi:hypothetical protein